MEEYTHDILDAVLNYARSHDIQVEKSWDLDEETPSMCDPEYRNIIINMNYEDQRQIPTQAAHEIEHVEQGHHGIQLFDGHDISGQEGEANRKALNILVPIYFADTDADHVDVEKFMDALAIPSEMEGYTLEAIEEYFG
jgi:Zn-dependent peptidase ImmA (M78 family)